MDAQLMQLLGETATVNMDKQGGIQLANGEIHISSVVCFNDYEVAYQAIATNRNHHLQISKQNNENDN